MAETPGSEKAPPHISTGLLRKTNLSMESICTWRLDKLSMERGLPQKPPPVPRGLSTAASRDSRRARSTCVTWQTNKESEVGDPSGLLRGDTGRSSPVGTDRRTVPVVMALGNPSATPSEVIIKASTMALHQH